MAEVLDFLLAPAKGSEFKVHYSRKPWFVAGEPAKFCEIFSWRALDQVLGSSPISRLPLRLVRQGRTITVTTAVDILKECRAGATLIVDRLHEVDETVGKMAASLSAEIGERVGVNLYFSQPGTQGFDAHYDTHDVFIAHLEGKKKWRIYEPPVLFPLSRQKFHPDKVPTTPPFDFLLNPGDLLYIPRGYWHEAAAQEEASLHLTIGIHPRTAADFTAWVLDELREDVEWRKPFPLVLNEGTLLGGGVPKVYEEHLEKIKDILSKKLSDPSLLSDYRSFCVAQDRPVRISLVPQAIEGENLSWSDDIQFSRASYQRVVLTPMDDNSFELIVWGKILRVEGVREELLRFIFSETTFSLGDLLARSSEAMADDITRLMKVLVSEGLVELIDGNAGKRPQERGPEDAGSLELRLL